MNPQMILVTPSADTPHQGILSFMEFSFKCALGRSGVSSNHVEGDGTTPIGTFPLRDGFFRADRLPNLATQTQFPFRPVKETDGWCDDPADPAYNQLITLPFAPSHEELWRADAVYDLIIPIGSNDNPVVPGKGSAIFFHVARPEYTATAGCIALSQEDFLTLLRHPNFNADTMMQIVA